MPTWMQPTHGRWPLPSTAEVRPGNKTYNPEKRLFRSLLRLVAEKGWAGLWLRVGSGTSRRRIEVEIVDSRLLFIGESCKNLYVTMAGALPLAVPEWRTPPARDGDRHC
jgi:hypothetical protein